MWESLEHPSGCDCPAPTVIDGGRVVLDVHTCPRCLEWERLRRYGQLEMDLEDGAGVADALEGDDMVGHLEEDPSDTLVAIRAADPSF